MKTLQKTGGIAAFYLAAVYLVGIVVFLFIWTIPVLSNLAKR